MTTTNNGATTTANPTATLAALQAAERALQFQIEAAAAALDTIGATLPDALARLEASAAATCARIAAHKGRLDELTGTVLGHIDGTAQAVAVQFSSGAATPAETTISTPIAATAPASTGNETNGIGVAGDVDEPRDCRHCGRAFIPVATTDRCCSTACADAELGQVVRPSPATATVVECSTCVHAAIMHHRSGRHVHHAAESEY